MGPQELPPDGVVPKGATHALPARDDQDDDAADEKAAAIDGPHCRRSGLAREIQAQLPSMASPPSASSALCRVRHAGLTAAPTGFMCRLAASARPERLRDLAVLPVPPVSRFRPPEREV